MGSKKQHEPTPEDTGIIENSRDIFEKAEYPNIESGVQKLLADLDRWEQSHPDQHSVVIIGGPTGAGKTTLGERLSGGAETTVLSLDRYYLSPAEQTARFGEVNFSIPQSLDVERIKLDMAKISETPIGQTIKVPVYSMTESQRTGEEDLILKRRIIVEGVYALSQAIIPSPFRIYVEAPQEELLQRKLRRDVLERGLSADAVSQRFHQNVIQAIDEYVVSEKSNATVIIQNSNK